MPDYPRIQIVNTIGFPVERVLPVALSMIASGETPTPTWPEPAERLLKECMGGDVWLAAFHNDKSGLVFRVEWRTRRKEILSSKARGNIRLDRKAMLKRSAR